MELIKLLNGVTTEYEITRCNTVDLINQSKKLRHKIYCEEKGWEPKNSQCIEQDAYDDKAIHYLISYRKSQIYIGTFRLIITQDLPLTKFMSPTNIFHPKNCPNNSVCEISRFSILKQYRNTELIKGLFLLIGYESVSNNLMGAFMVMEKSLAVQLRRSKINCQQVTDSFMLNGSRAIYFCSTAESLKTLMQTTGFEKQSVDLLFGPMFNDYQKAS